MWHILIGQVLTVHTLKHLKKYDWTHTELIYYIDIERERERESFT